MNVGELLLWGLAGVLFLMAVATFVFSLLVRDHERRYLLWVAVALWWLLCVALAVTLALVLRARFFSVPLPGGGY